MKVKETEEVVEKEGAGYSSEQTSKSPFEILDEVEGEGDFTLGSISDEVEKEIEEEQAEVEGEGTGLKADKKEKEASSKEEDRDDSEEDDSKAEKPEEEEEKEEEESSDEEKEEKAESSEKPQWLLDKLKELNPELDVENEEAVQGELDKALEAKNLAEKAQKDLEAEREANKSFYELLEGSDDLREVSRFMFKHNVGFNEALTALEIAPEVDMEKLKKEDPDAYLEAVKAKEKREAEAKAAEDKRKERDKAFQENETKTAENTQAFKKEAGLDEKGFEELTSQVNPHIEKLAEGLVTKDFLSILHKGITFEDAIAKAREEGLTEGKNMKIEEQARKKEGDQLPRITSTGPKKAEKEEEDIFSEALRPEPRISDIK